MNGVVLYQGPSMLDGQPIVVIATGLEKASGNGKTGALVQTWIMRADVSPTAAIATGEDVSICGDCLHRGDKGKNRSCYVQVFQAPRSVWSSWKRGIYSGDWSSSTFAGRKVRLGSYGDPAAVPLHVWRDVLAESVGHTGYTHQWRRAPELAAYCMASCDTAEEAAQAQFLGYRTFRTRLPEEPKLAGEFLCPASKEAGYKTSCELCLACGGTSSKAKANPVIIAHGAAPKVAAYRSWRG